MIADLYFEFGIVIAVLKFSGKNFITKLTIPIVTDRDASVYRLISCCLIDKLHFKKLTGHKTNFKFRYKIAVRINNG